MRGFLAGLALGLAFAFAPIHAQPLLVTGYVQTGITASGAYTVPGVAACPLWLDFGTVVVIDGVRQVTCLDRYSPLLSDRIDLWFASVSEAYAITGIHDVTVLED